MGQRGGGAECGALSVRRGRSVAASMATAAADAAAVAAHERWARERGGGWGASGARMRVARCAVRSWVWVCEWGKERQAHETEAR